MTTLTRRPRRLRTTPAIRRLVAETRVHPAQLILPVFVADGLAEPRSIGSMPGVVQHTINSLRAEASAAVSAGIGGIMLFGVPEADDKDAVGSAGYAPDGITLGFEINLRLQGLSIGVG